MPISNKDNLLNRIQELEREVAQLREQPQSSPFQVNPEQFRQMVDQANDIIYMHDFEGHILYGNQASFRLFGHSGPDLLNMTIFDLVDPTYHAVIRQEVRDRMDGHITSGTPFEILCRNAEKAEIWIETSIRFIHENRKVTLIQGIGRDITEVKKTRQALADSESRYKQLIDASPDAIVLYDTSNQVRYLNPAFTQMFGWTLAELKGKPIDYTPPQEAEATRKAIKQMKSGKSISGFQTKRRTKAGKVLDITLSSSGVFDPNKRITGNMVILRDETKRRAMERKLEASEEKYRTIIENIEDSFYEVDLSGNLTFFNNSLLKILGYSQKELQSMNNRRYMDSENAKAVYKTFNSVYCTGVPSKGIDWELIRKDGTRCTVEASVSLIKDHEGNPTGFRGVLRDITQRKKTEHAMKLAKEEAEAANKAKSLFLANMSHEIRTPMNGVIGMTGLLLDTELGKEQKEYAEIIRRSANSLLAIINDILDFSKIEAGQLDLEAIDFDLRITVEDVADILSVRTKKKGLAFACVVHHDIPSGLVGDPGRLKQILVNLAGNAIRFTDKGEVVIQVNLEEESDRQVTIKVSVSDTGIGIPETSQRKLFQSFSQVDTSSSRKYGGTGLGLAISKQLAEQMGGKIGMYSREGSGATFWFTAVFLKQKPLQKLPETKNALPGNLKVLLVANNRAEGMGMEEHLRYLKCRTTSAESGREALEKINHANQAKDPFQIVVMDPQLMDMDGETLGRAIKKHPANQTMGLILQTSLGMRGDAARYRDAGFAAFLTKPIRHRQLRHCLNQIICNGKKSSSDYQKPMITRFSLAEQSKRDFRILIVEDNAVNQQLALKLLEKMGYRADIASNGRAAVARLEACEYDLVLMDVQMPEMDGFEATQIIRERESKESGFNVPIIAMTAHAMKGDREKCLKAGMDDYISKPIQPDRLATIIHHYLKTDIEAQRANHA